MSAQLNTEDVPLDITKRMILAQLHERTGTSIFDSGSAYGRHWERNQSKTFEDLVANPVTLEANVYEHNGAPELELMGTVKVAAYMENNLTYSAELQALYEAWVEKNDPEGDKYERENMEAFAKSVHHGRPDEMTEIVYTYNEDNCLSQDLQFIKFTWLDGDGWEQHVVLVQLHQGCDARGGLGSPKAYILRDDVWFGDCNIDGYGCESQQWDRELDNCEKGPNLGKLPVFKFEYFSNLEAEIKALAQTNKNTPETIEAMKAQDKSNEQQEFKTFCENLDYVSIVVYNHTPYYVDSEPEEIFAESYSLMGVTNESNMKNQLKCLGITFDLLPTASGAGFTAVLEAHQMRLLFDQLRVEYPTYSEEDLVRSAAVLLHSVYPEYTFSITRPSGILPSRVAEGKRIIANSEDGTLVIDNTGYTLRTLQGAAAECDKTRRKWKIVLAPHGIVIGEILLKRTK